MTNKLLTLFIVALPAAAFSQVNTYGPFTGSASDGFESDSFGFVTSVSILGGDGNITESTGTNSLDITSGWSFYSDVTPHSGTHFLGGASVNYTITFATPAAEFGAYFATNANLADAVATFYNSSGAQIGSSLSLSAPEGSWAWDGYQDTSGIKSISIVADNEFDGFIDIDDMQYTPTGAPEPCSIAALSLGAVALIRRRRSRAR